MEASSLAKAVFVSGDLAYAAAAFSGLNIIDVSRPSVPVKVGSLDTLDYVQDIVVSGNLAFIADGRSGLRIVDVSNPSDPRELGSLVTSEAVNVAVSGSLA